MLSEMPNPDVQHALALADLAWCGDLTIREELEQATRDLEHGPHVAGFARCCLGLAHLATIDKDSHRAGACLDRGLSAASLEACPTEWFKLLNSRGYHFLVEGLLVEALEPLLSVVRRAPYVPGAEGEAAQAYGNLGAALSRLGDVQGCIEMLRHGQEYAQGLGIVSQIVQVAAALTLEETYRGHWAAAAKALALAQVTCDGAKDQNARTQRRINACLLRARVGVQATWEDPKEALQTAEEALLALKEWDDPEELCACVEFQALALWKLDRVEDAWQAVLWGLELARRVPGGRLLSRVAAIGAQIAEARGDMKGMCTIVQSLSQVNIGSGWTSVGAMVRQVIERNVQVIELRDADLSNTVQALRRSNEQLAEARDIAERAVAQRQQFLAHMSHELRTPLHGVMGTAELLQGTELNHEQEELVGIVRRSADLTLAVVDDILDLGKLEAKGLTLYSEVFLLQRPLEDVLAALRGRAKGTRLELDLSSGLPKAVRGDPRRLQQVLMNLVGNALKYARSGRVRVGLSVLPGDGVRFEVQDDGQGIAQERLADLFDPYVQANQLRGVGGTGLGLAICKGIVDGYGGQIGVRSELGKGSTFWFEIPLPAAEMEGHLVSTSQALLDGLTVLLAEDNPVNRMLMERQLQVLGARVLLAEDGAQAVRCALEHRPGLVLMDLHMPGLDGLEATCQLRKAGFLGPIVALTASVMEEDRGACLASGMDGFLTKPLSSERLLKMVGDLLRKVA
ncbi:MAG: signal transduction histidine kinase [Cognaticolwellia sp.]|jgi:signal transduction histidine kinase